MDATLPAPVLVSPRSTAGGTRAVVEDALAARRDGEAAALAIVLGTEGSTYVSRGAIALFAGGTRRTGWLSGGCLEPEIESQARQAAEHGVVAWLELDTRDDAQLFSGAALGCRGLLRIALVPLRALEGFEGPAQRWLDGEGAMAWRVRGSGEVSCAVGDEARSWTLRGAAPDWATRSDIEHEIALRPPPSVLLCGAGPEAPVLLPLLRQLGCITTVVEPRARWHANAVLADRTLATTIAAALARGAPRGFDAALVMHHGFELDRDALEALATTSIPYIGLLGPVRRREDLLRVLPAAAREALHGRLRSPIGMKLGGQGPEAIALSIAAQLQAHLHDA